jgi:UDPglucose 6-dehydrogenase
LSRVVVIGAGYVGLTTAACLAHLGHRVVAVDVDQERVADLRAGRMPILEEGLEALVAEGLQSGRLSFTTDAVGPAGDAEFVFLCVPTPQGDDGAADLRYVRQASSQIGPHLPPGAVVITKSTVPVGSAGLVGEALGRADIEVVSNPEFLREGTAVADWLYPERIVIGARRREAAEAVAGLYAGVDAPVVITDPVSSETVKYAANAFLAAKVSFVNAIANLCEAVGADVGDVLTGMAYDRRIGADHLSPGPGWGGSCFPKDTAALIRLAADAGYDFALLREAVAANQLQFDRVAATVAEAAGGSLEGRRIAVWGLTFKAQTDDLRESPAVEVTRRLVGAGARVAAYDPTRPPADHPAIASLDLELCADAYQAAEGADAVVVLTEWKDFADVDFTKVAEVAAGPAIVDTRNILDPEEVRAAGCSYRGIGRR